MTERPSAHTKAVILTQELQGVEIGESIRCTGLDADDCCTNIPYRDRGDCKGCGLAYLVNNKSNSVKILMVEKGVFKRI